MGGGGGGEEGGGGIETQNYHPPEKENKDNRQIKKPILIRVKNEIRLFSGQKSSVLAETVNDRRFRSEPFSRDNGRCTCDAREGKRAVSPQ